MVANREKPYILNNPKGEFTDAVDFAIYYIITDEAGGRNSGGKLTSYDININVFGLENTLGWSYHSSGSVRLPKTLGIRLGSFLS